MKDKSGNVFNLWIPVCRVAMTNSGSRSRIRMGDEMSDPRVK